MKYIESDRLALKSIFTQDDKKDMVAFLNTNGGKIIVGVNDDGEVIGIDNPKEIMEIISSVIHDAIKPDASMLCNVTSKIDDNKTVIEIHIYRGIKKPYFISDEGLKPSGVYVRIGNTSQPSSDDEIKSMLIEREKLPYELIPSFNQNLTFRSLEEIFSKEGIPLKYQTLKILNNDELYTNLGLFVSDQNPFSIKVAVYKGIDKSEFIDRKEFTGSLIKQVDDVYDYLKLNNKIKGTYNEMKRVDMYSYDNTVLRECILNSVIHRDYSLNGSNLISIFNNRIEFISIGGLISSMTYQDMILGVSRSRNEYLANIFFRINYVKAYGTGINKIMSSYQKYDIKPVIKVSDNGFLVSLPNKNMAMILSSKTDNYEEMLNYIRTNSTVTRTMIQEHFGYKLSKTIYILKQLINDKKIAKVGSGRNTTYIIVN